MIRHQPHIGGWAEVICGPMFSGKSEELIRRLKREAIAGNKVIAFKPVIDDRWNVEQIVTHDGQSFKCYPVLDTLALLQHEGWEGVIGIDEAQFFDSGLYPVVQKLKLTARVIIAGLDMTYRREPFGTMPDLLATSEFIDKLQAVCHSCGEPAPYTQRLIDGSPAPFVGETILVGARDSYEARCAECFEPA